MATGRPPWKDLGFSSHLTLFRHISSITEPPPIDSKADILVGVHDGHERFEMYKLLVGTCFNLDPAKRPSAPEMLQNPFFHDNDQSWFLGDESECSHLFSPSPNRKSLSPRLPAHANLSPIPRSRRNMSTGATGSPFLSPPLPPSNNNNKRSSITPDTSDWPSWAKQSHAKAEKAKTKKAADEGARDSLCSLSYSLDVQMKENRSVPATEAFTSTVGDNSSALLGLDFVSGGPSVGSNIIDIHNDEVVGRE
jgi:hypothetical protein